MSEFKIAAAQVPSIRGDFTTNIQTHAAAIVSAAKQRVSVLVFPELSLLGYEPDLAAELSITPTDARFMPLIAMAERHQMAIILGAPLRIVGSLPALGAILLAPNGATRTYAKMHLGGTEPKFFTKGDTPVSFTASGQTIGVAICADSSKRSHPRSYADAGATIYASGVFLNSEWYATDAPRLSDYAASLRMLVVMANHGASVGTYHSVGKSAIWGPEGQLLAEASGTQACLVIATLRDGAWSGTVLEI